MDERPKRTITKPVRYQTTFSDEAPVYKKIASVLNNTATRIEKDIADIRATLEKDTNNSDNNLIIPTHTQNISSHTYTHIPIHTTPTASAHSSQETLPHTSHSLYTPHENEHLYYTNNTCTQLQNISRQWTTQGDMQHPFHEERLPWPA